MGLLRTPHAKRFGGLFLIVILAATAWALGTHVPLWGWLAPLGLVAIGTKELFDGC